MPRRMRWRVILEKKFSTALSQDPEVGVKWKTQREDPARVASEPGFNFGMLVGGVIASQGISTRASARMGSAHPRHVSRCRWLRRDRRARRPPPCARDW